MKAQTRVKSRRSSKNKKNRELKKELGKKLLGYSVAAGAVLTIGAGVAEAVAMKTTLGTPETIGLGGFFDLDIDGDGKTDVVFQAFSTTSFTVTTFTYNYALVAGGSYSIGGPINPNFNEVVASTISSSALNLPILSPINAILLYNSGTAGIAFLGSYDVFSLSGYGNFLGSRGFLGVGFNIGGSTGFTHFGWVDLEVNSDASLITIFAYGYNDESAAPIGAGEPVPEPATLVTLAMGAAGIYAWRRNRKRKSVKNTTQNETQNV